MHLTLDNRRPAPFSALAAKLLVPIKKWGQRIVHRDARPDDEAIRRKLKATIWLACTHLTPIAAMEIDPDYRVRRYVLEIGMALKQACAEMGAPIDLATLLDMVGSEAEANGLGDSLVTRCSELVLQERRAAQAC